MYFHKLISQVVKTTNYSSTLTLSKEREIYFTRALSTRMIIFSCKYGRKEKSDSRRYEVSRCDPQSSIYFQYSKKYQRSQTIADTFNCMCESAGQSKTYTLNCLHHLLLLHRKSPPTRSARCNLTEIRPHLPHLLLRVDQQILRRFVPAYLSPSSLHRL